MQPCVGLKTYDVHLPQGPASLRHLVLLGAQKSPPSCFFLNSQIAFARLGLGIEQGLLGRNQQGNSNTGEIFVVNIGDIEQRLVPDEVAPSHMEDIACWVKPDQIHTKRVVQAHIQDTALN